MKHWKKKNMDVVGVLKILKLLFELVHQGANVEHWANIKFFLKKMFRLFEIIKKILDILTSNIFSKQCDQKILI